MEINETNKYLELCYSHNLLNVDNNLLFKNLLESGYTKQQINQFMKASESNIYLALHNFFNIEIIRNIREVAEEGYNKDSLIDRLNNNFFL